MKTSRKMWVLMSPQPPASSQSKREMGSFRTLWFPALLIFALISLSGDILGSDPPLDEQEQQAFQAAADFSQDNVVQVETFGGQEIVN
ncbi:MAG TPA: hypothetical protein VM260_07375, partial [Pirellula sp.]|nr:hypothetical protein [Pirellula sp.]